MIRIWKVYDLPLRVSATDERAARVAMSSYPISLASTDDFVISSHALVALSTQLDPCPNSEVRPCIPETRHR